MNTGKGSGPQGNIGFVDADPFLTTSTRKAVTTKASHAQSAQPAHAQSAQPAKPRSGFLFHCQSLTMLIFVPWLLFVVCACAVGLTLYIMPAAGMLVVGLCLIFSGVFFYLGKVKKLSIYLYIGILGFIGVLCGCSLGFAVDGAYFSQYFSLVTKRTYTNLLATQLAASHSDAGLIGFAESARITQAKVVGRYEGGTNYCVAPIQDVSKGVSAQFWAAGFNCCLQRSSFRCDDALSRSSSAGLVILKSNSSGYDGFRRAAQQAAAVYGLTTLPKDPVFVRWVEDPFLARYNLLRDGFAYIIFFAVVYLICIGMVASVLHVSTRNNEAAHKRTAHFHSHA